MPNDTDERYNIDIALSTNPALDFTQDSSQTNMGLNQVNWGWCPNQKKAQVNQYKVPNPHNLIITTKWLLKRGQLSFCHANFP